MELLESSYDPLSAEDL